VLHSIHLFISLIFLSVLGFGLLQAKKHSFMAGVYCFAILIILRSYSLVSHFITNAIVDYYFSNTIEPPFGLSIGEVVFVLSLLPRIIELIAFFILIIGLYKVWNPKT
jgi:hypothetical protein